MSLTPEQFEKLIDLLGKIADKRMVIADAADWPILVVMGGVLACVMGFMWRDIRSQIASLVLSIKETRSENMSAIDSMKAVNDRAHGDLWGEIRDCQKTRLSRTREA